MSDEPVLAVTHQAHGNGGKYVARLHGEDATGYLEWEVGAERAGRPVRIATHTVVPRKIGGRGVAGALVERLIMDAREQGFLIVPQCSYVAAKFDDNPEWSELRA